MAVLVVAVAALLCSAAAFTATGQYVPSSGPLDLVTCDVPFFFTNGTAASFSLSEVPASNVTQTTAYTIYFDLCAPLVTPIKDNCVAGTTYACQHAASTSTKSNAAASTKVAPTYSVGSTGVLTLNYGGGTNCPGQPGSPDRSVVYNFICGSTLGSPTFVGEVSCKYTISWTSSLFCPRPRSFLQQNCSIQDDETGLQYDLTPLKGTTYFAPAGYYTNSNGQESYYSYHSYIAVCRDALVCNKVPNSGVCSIYDSGMYLSGMESLGLAYTIANIETILTLSGRNLEMSYGQFSPSASYVKIQFVCDYSIDKGFPEIFSVNQEIVYKWATKYACPINVTPSPLPAAATPTCVYGSSHNTFFDFSSLAGDIEVNNGLSTFKINLCAPITLSGSPGSCTLGSTYVCATSSSAAPVAIGTQIPTTAQSMATSNGINLVFSGGAEYCGVGTNSKAQFNMICGQSNSGPSYVGYSNCVHTFTWTTEAACADPVSPPPSTSTWNGWGAFVHHKCGGNTIDLFPNTPGFKMQLGIGNALTLIDAILNFTLDRAQCECSQAGGTFHQSDFDILFDPMTAFFNIIDMVTMSPSPAQSCVAQMFPRTLLLLDVLQMRLPPTCNYESWSNTGTCFVKLPLPDLDLTLTAAFQKCEGETIPSLSINCDGPGCNYLMVPCTDSSQCGTIGPCFDLYNFITGKTESSALPSSAFYFLWNSGILTNNYYNNVTRGAFQSLSLTQPRGPNNDVVSSLLSFVLADNGITDRGTIVDPKFCGMECVVGLIVNGTDECMGEFSGEHWVKTGNYDRTQPLKCWQPADTDYSTTPRQIIISQDVLQNWDGKLADGSSALSFPGLPDLPSNPTFPSQNAIRVFQFNCDGDFVLSLWGQTFGFAVSDYHRIASYLTTTLYRLIAAEAPMSKDTFKARFGVFNILMYLLHYENGAKENYANLNVPPYYDYVQRLYEGIKIMNLPSSCTFENVTLTGTCSFDWSGLQSLLKSDMVVRVRSQTCPNSEFLSSFTIDCIGTDCSNFAGIIPCDQNSDCPTSTQLCSNIVKEIDYAFSTSLQLDDWFDFYLGVDNIEPTDQCLNVPFQDRVSNVEQACSGPKKFWNQVTKTMTSLFGGPYAGKLVSDTNVGSFCMPKVQIFDGTMWSSWLDSLVTVNGDQVYINFLSEAPLNDFPAEDTSAGLSSGGAIAVIVVISLVGVAAIAGLGYFIYKRRQLKDDTQEPLLGNRTESTN